MKILIAAALMVLTMPSMATEYIFRDLMANTLPSAQCRTPAQASETASKPYTLERYSKQFCQTQGYGWHLHQIKTAGTTICTPCADQTELQKCHQQDVVVSCQRVKPGSVGMLPGKG